MYLRQLITQTGAVRLELLHRGALLEDGVCVW